RDARVLVEQDRERDAELLDLAAHARRVARLVDRDAEHDEAAPLLLSVDLVERRHREQTRLAERRPEIDQDHVFTEVIREAHVAAAQRGQLEVRRRAFRRRLAPGLSATAAERAETAGENQTGERGLRERAPRDHGGVTPRRWSSLSTKLQKPFALPS